MTADGKAGAPREVPLTLVAALVEFQARMPVVVKDEQADIQGKDGKQGPKYRYASLGAVIRTAQPHKAACGLAFTSRPTTGDDGKFGLHYRLLHVSGEKDEGVWPLPPAATPQNYGSLLTYYRRYVECCVLGIITDDDDDGQAAQVAHEDAAGWAAAGFTAIRALPEEVRDQLDDWYKGKGWGNPAGWDASQWAAAFIHAGGLTARPEPPFEEPAPDGPDERAQELAELARDLSLSAVDIAAIRNIARSEGKLNAEVASPASGKTGPLAAWLDWRHTQAEATAKAWSELSAAARERGWSDEETAAHVTKATGTDANLATATQVRAAAAKLPTAPEPDGQDGASPAPAVAPAADDPVALLSAQIGGVGTMRDVNKARTAIARLKAAGTIGDDTARGLNDQVTVRWQEVKPGAGS